MDTVIKERLADRQGNRRACLG